MEFWKDEILNGVKLMDKIGTPGNQVICGELTRTIITGDKASDIILSVAEYGGGRIAVFSHDGYINHVLKPSSQFERLMTNLKRWLVKGQTIDESRCIPYKECIKDMSSLQKAQVVVWNGVDGTPELVNAIDQFLLGGGGLVVGMTPWGYLQLNPSKSLADMAVYPLLEKVGIYYTSDYVYGCDEGFRIKQKETQHPAGSRMSDYKSAVSTVWRKEILDGVTKVPKEGVPGRLILVGPMATPILTGNSPNKLLLAAAEYGNGRIIVFSHNGYIRQFANPTEDFQRLVSNIKKWLMKNPSDSGQNMVCLNGAKTFPKSPRPSIVFWDGADENDPQLVEEVDAYVFNGGCLVTGMCPWGYLQLNPSKTLQDMAVYPILKKVGIYYTDDYLNGSDEGFHVEQDDCNVASAHFGEALQKLCQDSSTESYNTNVVVADGLRCLPSDCLPEDMSSICQKLEQELNLRIGECCPVAKRPVSTRDGFTYSRVKLYNQLVHKNAKPGSKVSGVNIFPGDMENPEAYFITKELKKSSTKHASERYATGVYLPPGVEMIVKVLHQSRDGRENWNILIGAHTDDLSECDRYERWPCVHVYREIDGKKSQDISVVSSFGGNVYLESPAVENKSGSLVHIRLNNVVPSPHCDCTDKDSIKKWKDTRLAPGLWADIESKYMTITLPSESIRKMGDPSPALQAWDKVIAAHHDLRGTDPALAKRLWTVTDIQPVAGYMHSGYPIVTCMDVSDPQNKHFLLTDALQRIGNWGMFHEIGHNMQRGEWTFDGTVEVTCNIFTLHAFDTVCQIKPWIHEWLQGNFKATTDYLNKCPTKQELHQKWKEDPGMGLWIYAQLQNAFGWEPFKKVFREYEGMKSCDKPNNNQEKIDQWFIRFSKAVKKNLLPLFDYWGLPVSDSAKKETKNFHSFIPNDDITQAASKYTKIHLP